jgi:hypothetical protein
MRIISCMYFHSEVSIHWMNYDGMKKMDTLEEMAFGVTYLVSM